MISAREVAVIFDLDGTVLQANSYRLLLRWIVAAKPTGWADLRFRLRVAGLGFSSLAGLRGRVACKRRVHELLVVEIRAGRIDQLMQDFGAVLQRHVDREVLHALETANDAGCLTVLATAALAEYSEPLGAALGFNVVVATRWSETWTENMGEVKRDATLRELEGRDRPHRVLLTDHHDDRPLADVCRWRFWVEPDRSTNTTPPEGLGTRYTWRSFSEWFTATIAAAHPVGPDPARCLPDRRDL